jgi:hypothetical protein
VWWLYLIATRLSVAPQVGSDGKIVLDEFQRAKDILLVVLPLFSASIAFWAGSAGTADAKKDASKSKEHLKAVLDASPQGVLERAQTTNPTAFQ